MTGQPNEKKSNLIELIKADVVTLDGMNQLLKEHDSSTRLTQDCVTNYKSTHVDADGDSVSATISSMEGILACYTDELNNLQTSDWRAKETAGLITLVTKEKNELVKDLHASGHQYPEALHQSIAYLKQIKYGVFANSDEAIRIACMHSLDEAAERKAFYIEIEEKFTRELLQEYVAAA